MSLGNGSVPPPRWTEEDNIEEVPTTGPGIKTAHTKAEELLLLTPTGLPFCLFFKNY